MADTIYIKYFKMWKCQQNVEEAVSAANIKEMVKITNSRKKEGKMYNLIYFKITGWIFSYLWAPGSLGKNVMTNLVGTKPYSDQLSVWGHFTASTNQIRTPLKQTSCRLLLATGVIREAPMKNVLEWFVNQFTICEKLKKSKDHFWRPWCGWFSLSSGL